MSKQAIATAEAPAPAGPYSQAVTANGFFFCAGFGPQDASTGAVVEGGVYEQTQQVLRNIERVLQVQDLTLDNVVKVTAHLQNLHADFEEFNRAYAEFFVEPYPVRTTVGSELANILVEIDVIAACPTDRPA